MESYVSFDEGKIAQLFNLSSVNVEWNVASVFLQEQLYSFKILFHYGVKLNYLYILAQ